MVHDIHEFSSVLRSLFIYIIEQVATAFMDRFFLACELH